MVLAPLVLATSLYARHAPAQHASAAERRFYVYAAGYAAYHPANGPLYHRVQPALGGTGIDLAFGGGGFINRRVGLEGEVVFGGDVSGHQRFSYNNSEEYIEHNRDFLLNELVRFRADRRGIVQLVGGGGYARTTTRETSIVDIDSFGRRSSPPDGFPLTNQGLTWSAGVDVVIASSTHVAVTPSVRVRWVRQPDPQYGNGIGAFTWQFGATIFLR